MAATDRLRAAQTRARARLRRHGPLTRVAHHEHQDGGDSHSFVSRHLANDASLDEVSAAVGHSSPVVTKRFYDHFIRRSFSPRLRTGLGLGKQPGGRVVPMPKR